MGYRFKIAKAMGKPISAIVITPNRTKVVSKGQSNFDALVQALENRADDSTVEALLDNKGILDKVLKSSEDYLNLLDDEAFEGDYTVLYDSDQERILLNGIPMDNKLTNLILRYVSSNQFDKVQPLAMFLCRVMLNPVTQSRRDLFEFLSHNRYGLAEDGRFYAYKSIANDGSSHTSGRETVYVDGTEHVGRIPNPDGAIISMARDLVDDNSGVHCSTGLHIGSLRYARSFRNGAKIVQVLVDPEHVVSVPNDDTAGKMRTCQYEVVGDYDPEKSELGMAIL